MSMDDNNGPFRVIRTNGGKEKELRVFMSMNKPTLQVKSAKCGHVKEINLSGSAKIFIPISNNHRFEFKILSTSSTSFYCTEEKTFKECTSLIDRCLQKYHQNRESVDSIPSTRSSMSRRSKESCSSSSQLNDDDVYCDMQNILIRDEKPKGNNDDTVTTTPKYNQIRKLSNVFIEDALQIDYPVPPFNIADKALKEGYENVSNIEIPRDCDKIIADVLKLQAESGYPGGLEFNISQNEMKNFDVVGCCDFLWISAVKMPDKRLHVGDKICTINGVEVQRMVEFNHCNHLDNILLRIQRLPKAKVFALAHKYLETSYEQDLVFHNEDLHIYKNRKESWTISEIDYISVLDAKAIPNIQNSDVPFHLMVIHPTQFIKQMRGLRRSSLDKH